MVTAPECIKTTQLYNRRSVGFLWDKRAELDPGQVSILNSIYNNKKKGQVQASQEISYSLSRSMVGKLGYGRLYGSKGSFETLEKECRGTICKDYYHDLDIANCHPVLLSQFAKSKFDIDLPEVDKYVENREAYLKEVAGGVMTRDEAKEAIIKVLYGGLVNDRSFLYPLSLEIRGLSKKLFVLPEYAELSKAVKSEKNIYGSFLAYLLQTEERHCMLAMKSYLEKLDWSVDVLCYDGVMIRQRDDQKCDATLLTAVQQYVQDATGYSVTLTTKEFSYFDIPVTGEEIAKGVTKEAYMDMKREFESFNFYYCPTNEYYEYREGKTPLTMCGQHANEYYKTKWLFKHSEKHGDYTQFFDLWRQDHTRRVIRSMSFRPSADPEVYQIPLHLAYQDTTASSHGAIDLFMGLVKLICSDKEPLITFTLDWLAHMLQKPYELSRVSIIVTGEKGVGKDTVFDFFMKYVIGDMFSTNYNDTKTYFEKHDCERMHKLLVKLEEADAKTCWDNANTLKGRVTGEKDKFNPKGQKSIIAENIARVVMTTNGACPVDLGDKDRRFVIMKSSSEKRGDSDYWNMIRKELFTPEAGRAVANMLLEREITSDWNSLPENDYQEAVTESRVSSEERFVTAWDGEDCRSNDLFEKYKNFCTDSGYPYVNNAIAFGKKLVVFVRNNTVATRKSNGNTLYYKP